METTRVGHRRAPGLTWGSAVLCGVVVVLIVSMVSAGIAAVSARSGTTPSFIHPQPGSIHWNGRDRLNVLILGVDAGSGQGEVSALTLASFNPRTRSARILSIPSNLWVTIPGFGQAPIGDAYADGGPRLALLVAQSVTHIVIPYYLALGSDAYRQVIDAYGGITIHDASFVAPRNVAGAHHMAGAAALDYMHPAHSASPAITAMRRQGRILGALLHAVLQPQSLFQLPAVINATGQEIDTNFPYNQMPALARTLEALPPSRVQHLALDYTSGAVADYSANGTTVLLPDWQRIYALTRSGYTDDLRKGPGIDVLNGSGQLGAAANLASRLKGFALHVTHYGSADRFDYSRTQILVRSGARISVLTVARAVAATLQAPVVTRTVHAGEAPVVVIIGRDYQDASQQ